MKNKSLYFLLIFIFALLTAACNNDVFVDEPSDFDDETVTLQSPYDNHTVYFQPADVDRVSIYHNEKCRHVLVTPQGGVKIDEEGHEVEVDRADGGKVEIYGNACILYVDIDNRGAITISNSENYSREPFTAKVILFHGEMYRTIKISVQPGRQFNVQFVFQNLDKPFKIEMRERNEGVMTYNNNTDSEQTIAIKPYQGSMTAAQLFFADNCHKLLNFEEAPEMELITALSDSMLCYDGRTIALSPDLQQLPPLDADREVRYRLPAHTSVQFTRTLIYANVEVPLTIYATRPDEESEQHQFQATLKVLDPIDFKLDYEIVE